MTPDAPTVPSPQPAVPVQSLVALFRRFLGFGLLAWGGPVAQIAMLRRELVDQERWISSDRFNRTLAVYQALPGPEAHELCVYFGYLARGRVGGLLAGLGFMLPGLGLMLALSWFYVSVGLASPLVLAFFAGAQAAVLALIVRGMHRIGRHAVTDRWLAAIAVVAAIAAAATVHFAVVLAVSGLVYLLAGRARAAAAAGLLGALIVGSALAVSQREAADPVGTGDLLGAGRTVAATATPAELLGSGLKAGLLTFGGAYTAIPFLQSDVQTEGWMTREVFLDGVALGGILPAPLIIFSTFVGYVAGGPGGALAMTLGVFAPAFAFTLAGHRQLERLVEHRPTHALLDGVTAGVVGLVAAAAVALAPVAVSSILGGLIFASGLALLYRWKSALAVPSAVLGAGLIGILVPQLLRLVPR